MSDLISRADVLSELYLDHEDVIYIDKVETAKRIRAIPSAQTWIPVTERLPEEDEECIVTYDAEIVGAKIYHVSERVYPELVWWGKGKWTDRDGLSIGVNVTAWMPKPEPYREESKDDN